MESRSKMIFSTTINNLCQSLDDFLDLPGRRWRKASKCKSMLKKLELRLGTQKNRKNVIIRQLRADIAQLLQNGHHKAALSRVEQLYKEQHIFSAYGQVEKFRDCVLNNLVDISRQREVSRDVREAVSSLIFAASRCGELTELHSIRYLFKGLLGQKFERDNVELLPGNSVNSQTKHSLSIKSVAEDVRIRLINEITKEYRQDLEPQIKVPVRSNSKEYHEPTIRYNSQDLGSHDSKGVKGQPQARNYEEMLQKRGSKFCLRDCNNTMTFWNTVHDGSARIAGSFTSTEANTLELQKNPENFMNRVCPDDKRIVDENCNVLIKKDSKAAMQDRTLCGKDKRDVRAQCFSKDKRGNPNSQITHVHPKLPDYEDLVAKFMKIKKENIKRRLNYQGLSRWLSC